MKKHLKLIMVWLGITMLVGGVSGFYHLAMPRFWRITSYSPLSLNRNSPPFTVDETIFYASKVREILDGNWWLGDVDILENKNMASPFVGEELSAILMAGLAKVGGGVKEAFMLADFIFPSLIFLSLTTLIYLLTKKRYLAATGALVVMFFYHYLAYFPYLPSAIKLMAGALKTGAYAHFVRSFHPQISFLIFLVFSIVLWLNFKPEKKKVDIDWWLGLLLGILVYTHLFYFSFAFVWTGLCLGGTMVAKNKRLKKRLSLALGIGLILSLVYWLNLYWFNQLPQVKDFLLNSSFETNWRFKDMGLVVGLMGLGWWGLKDKDLKTYWSWFGVSGLGLMVGSKLVGLSFDDPVGHWLVRVIYPMAVVFMVVFVLRRLKRDYKLLGIGLTLMLLFYQTRTHWQYFKHQAQAFQIETERLEVFEWLNNNTPKDSVVVTTSLKDNLYLPTYTHNNVFIPRSQLSFSSSNEALERFLMVYKTAEVAEKRLEQMFSLTEENKELIKRKRFSFDDCGGVYLYFRRFVGADYYNCSVPKEQLKVMLSQYRQIEPGVVKYQADYWLWGLNEQQWAQVSPDELENLRLVWENKAYQVYKLTKK